jgi:hypothetical protein
MGVSDGLYINVDLEVAVYNQLIFEIGLTNQRLSGCRD